MTFFLFRLTRFFLVVLALGLISASPLQPGFCQDRSNSEQLPELISAPILPRRQITLIGAIELARRNYPGIKTATLRSDAVRESITEAKAAYIPKLELLFDENYGTANNITGFLAPQAIVPNISGTVRDTNRYLGGFGFTTGALLSWEPFDFGLRKARIHEARSATFRAQAQAAVTELEVQSRAAEAFITAIATEQVVKAARAKVERLSVFLETVRVLAGRELKAQTDIYLAEAELVKSKDELIVAEQNQKIALASLVRWTGSASDDIRPHAGGLIQEARSSLPPIVDPRLHPDALAQSALIDVVNARRRVLERSFAPRFFMRFPINGRGSTFSPDLSMNFRRGYYPTTFNYAISALVLFPVTDIFTLKPQIRAQRKNELAERARYDEIILNLKEQDARARAMVEGAIKIAGNAPVKLRAAQEAANSTKIRYRYQLASVNDVALDEQRLTQAQVDFATAQLQIWRALLASALARGDLKPFVDQVSSISGGAN